MQKETKQQNFLTKKLTFFPKMHLMLGTLKPTHGKKGEVHHLNKQQSEARSDEP
jgi:hypothetical protein